MTQANPGLVPDPPKLDTLEACLTYTQTVAGRVESGELAPSIGNCLTGLVGLATKIREAAIDEALLARLEVLERTTPKTPQIVEGRRADS